jgi:hypothetical protein
MKLEKTSLTMPPTCRYLTGSRSLHEAFGRPHHVRTDRRWANGYRMVSTSTTDVFPALLLQWA